MEAPNDQNRQRPIWIALFLGSTLALLYPAVVNGYPLMFPDGVDYLFYGRPILRALIDGEHGFFGVRSEFFPLSLYPMSLGLHFWLSIIFSAAVTAVTLFLLFDRDLLKSAASISILTLISTLPWHVSQIMPDYLAGLTAIWCFLLLRPLEGRTKTGVALLLAYSFLSHTSHLILGILLLPALALYLPRNESRKLLPLIYALVGAVAFQLVFSWRLYGRPHLYSPNSPPFLTARILSDGTGIRYLNEHPDEPLYPYRSLVVPQAGHILWEAQGLMQTLSRENPDLLKETKQREWGFVARTVTSYPMEQLQASARNFYHQLRWCNLDLYDPNPYIEKALKRFFPAELPTYLSTRQARETLPLAPLRRLVLSGLAVSMAAILQHLVRHRGQLRPEKKLFLFIAVVTSVINAAITGIISSPESRYQSRVIWLVPLTAIYLYGGSSNRAYESEATADDKHIPHA